MSRVQPAAGTVRSMGVIALVLSLAMAAWAGQAAAVSMEEAKEGAGDIWIEARITTTYTLNDQLSPLELGVEVNGGKVTLTGTVDSEVEKELAGEIARGVEGVTQVTNEIEVAPSEAAGKGPKEESQLRRFVDDAEISSKIRARVVWSKSLSLLNVDVSTEDNVVTLSGTVPGDAERELLGRIAANTEGVKSVNNEVQVGGEEGLAVQAKRQTAEAVGAAGRAVSNTWITAKVKASLAMDKSVDAADISVDTSEGVVHLVGTVASEAEARSAIDIASSIKGVERVDASLTMSE